MFEIGNPNIVSNHVSKTSYFIINMVCANIWMIVALKRNLNTNVTRVVIST